MDLVAISGDFIVMVEWISGKIYVHEIGDGYELARKIDLSEFDAYVCDVIIYIRDIKFLDAEIVMVTTKGCGIFFVSVESGQCISHFHLENSNELESAAAVMTDGRICVGGDNGYCALFQLPTEVDQVIGQYVERFLPPLGDIYHATHEKYISIPVAVDSVLRRISYQTSIQQSASAHLIVMAAVKSKQVPRSR